MPRKQLPEGWCEPTRLALEQYRQGIRSGLVPAGHLVLQQRAERVAHEDIGSGWVQGVVRQMYRVIETMSRAGRLPYGLAAQQVGELACIILLPVRSWNRGETLVPTDFAPVYNPEFAPDSAAGDFAAPHGCFSTDQAFARLTTPDAGVLAGFDQDGEPVCRRLTGLMAAAAQHEAWHLDGVRAPDIAIRCGQQIDCRPPELTQDYRDANTRWMADPANEPPWPYPYPPAQWRAVLAGDFALGDYLVE